MLCSISALVAAAADLDAVNFAAAAAPTIGRMSAADPDAAAARGAGSASVMSTIRSSSSMSSSAESLNLL